MRILYLGDIMGKSGRQAVIDRLPDLRDQLGLDFVIACGENAAHGFGITVKICEALFSAGVDVITTGNHAWDQKEIIDYIPTEPRLLRPINYADGTPGLGSGLFETGNGQQVAVCQLMGRLNMPPIDDPFRALEIFLAGTQLGQDADAIVVDIHGEATSEKTALGCIADGRASLAVGSHSHIPTSDTRILPAGTGFQTDAGMCGPFDSVIGMDAGIAVRRFVDSLPGERLEPATGVATICGVMVETDSRTGLAEAIYPLRDGGELSPVLPPIP
ncbi:MAG: TIGR00282 family metallophosphoesterase [Rhodospirillaceae bacterium]|nr:TIGR00282 family metallophosphoesterase [Rhodospirillaceae bacterium]